MMKQKNGRLKWFLPLMIAIPILCAVMFAVMRWGEKLMELIQVAIKMAVI